MKLEALGVGKGGAGGAVAPPLFEKGGIAPPPTFWAVICINCLYSVLNILGNAARGYRISGGT